MNGLKMGGGSMKFEEGKILSSMTVIIDGAEKEILFRFPHKGDAEGAMNAINSYVEEELYLTRTTTVALEEEEEWIASLIPDCIEKKTGMIVVEYEGKYAGSVSVRPGARKASHTASLGLAIIKEIRGKGIGTKVIQLAMEYGIDELGIELFWLEVFAENTRAIKLYETLGFTHAGTMPGFYKWKGRYLDNTHMYKCVRNR